MHSRRRPARGSSPHGACSTVDGGNEQKEQHQTTKDLSKTIFVDLASGEKHCSDRECLEYEREYFPLHVFMNSCVGVSDSDPRGLRAWCWCL